MVIRSESTAGSAVFGLPAALVKLNPARRGPIVLATDGTSDTGGTVAAALLIGARLDRPVEVVTVLQPLPAFTAGPDVIAPIDPAVDDDRREAREASVREYVSRFAGGAAPPRIEVRFGHVAREIARFARERAATMVIVGSAPRERSGRRVSGEMAAQILHASQCPVLSVPPHFTALPRTVLAAVDFGAASVRAAQAALLAVADGGTVHLLYVAPRPFRVEARNIVPQSELVVHTHALFDLLHAEIAASIPDGVHVEIRTATGEAAEQILSTSADLGAELIAVGTHGPGWLARTFLGSVADAVLHGAEHAVLAAPPVRTSGPPAPAHDDDPPDADRDDRWAIALHAFAERHAGRTVTLAKRSGTRGSSVTAHGYVLRGATYDPATHRVEIVVGDADGSTRHLTISIRYPDTITIRTAPDGSGEVLEVHHGPEHTVVAVP